MHPDPLHARPATVLGTLRRLRRSPAVSQSALVFAASMVLSVGGFVFHAIASRRLGVEDYGALYAILSVYLLACTPALLFTSVIAKYCAEFRALHDDKHVRGLIVLIVRAFGATGLIYIIVAFAFARHLAAFLHVSAWEIPLIGVMAAIGLFSGALRAVGQGTHDFAGYAVSLAAEGAMKIVALVALALGGLTVFRSTAGFLIGLAIGLAVMAYRLLQRYRRIDATPITLDWRRLLATFAGAASITITVALIGSADVVLVKHFFSSANAGLYSAASLGGKILLYFVGFIPAVLVPHATDRHARGERTRQTIGAAMAFIAFFGIAGVIAYAYFGNLVLRALVGPAFDAAVPLLVGYGGAMALLAATSALASYGIATHRLAFAGPLLAAALATIGIIAFAHHTLTMVIAELLFGNIAMLAVVAGAIGWQGARSLR
ncbi:MAG: hypothetical protein M3R51_02040 [Candidatus Eremiobacteraeota bacterium]|nr:hypothetical protein [Candidatus Eremiobacteraeota bacterium]